MSDGSIDTGLGHGGLVETALGFGGARPGRSSPLWGSRARSSPCPSAAADGRPVVAGLQFPNGRAQPVIERFTVDGSLDRSFAAGGPEPDVAILPGLTGTLLALTRQPDGGRLAGGTQDASVLVAGSPATAPPIRRFRRRGA